jgi:hypothetical protein
MRRTTLLILFSICWFATALLLNGCGGNYSPPLPAKVDFNYDIRPILVQKCFLCHGPDVSSRKAGLRLDTYEGVTALSKEGTQAITPGHPDNSTMIYRITHRDPEIRMPPPETNTTLSEREIALIEKWIDQGAEWKPHWALIPPEIPADLPLNDQNSVDFFVDKKLEQHDLEPVDEADKNTLIRRVAFILTGLPPLVEDVERYLNDNTADAYETMLDRYLNSTGFGERWARHWMDMVRYAETKGHEFDYQIPGSWMYRDYLIRAFNNDLPYDQLVTEHIAGDLMQPQRINPETGLNESHLATAFYAMSEGTHSPVDVRQDEADRIDNIIDVTGKAFQSLTVSCARCHDHKFDPITTKDYYSLFGIMESTRFSPVPAKKIDTKEIENVEAYKKSIRQMLASEWSAKSSTIPARLISQKGVSPVAAKDLTILGDFRENSFNDWKADGFAFGEKTTLGVPVFDGNGHLVSLEDGQASSRAVGTAVFGALRSPNFKIESNFIGVRAEGKNATIRIIIDNFQLISYPIYGGIEKKVAKGQWENVTFDVALWKGHKAYIEILNGVFQNHVFKMKPDSYVNVKYAIAFNDKWKEPQLSPVRISSNPEEAIRNWKNFSASSTEITLLNKLLKERKISTNVNDVAEPLDKLNQMRSALVDSGAFFNGIYDGFGIESPVFVRGSPQQLSKTTEPRRFISAINLGDTIFRSKGSGRMELAKSIANPNNPLTARVMVNRIWHHVFGRGIVETVDNFGMQGKLPTHPELLDYLALKFVEDNWSVKKTIRRLLTSDVFKRSVKGTEAGRKADPNNLWYAHFPVRRLEGEAIRDALLAVSGKLDSKMYGAPVPAYISSFMNGRGKPKESGPIDGLGRRSIYLEVRRNFLDPFITTFDRPIPFASFGKRDVTNVPAQSLILMNDPFVAMQAEAMACLVTGLENLTREQRIEWIYVRAFTRKPTNAEVVNGMQFINDIAASFKVQEKTIDKNVPVWKEYCHSIFNLKEFIYLM